MVHQHAIISEIGGYKKLEKKYGGNGKNKIKPKL